MNEWPEHPRLRDALARQADDVELDDGHRHTILSELLNTPAASVRTHSRWRRRSKTFSIGEWTSPVIIGVTVAVAAVGGVAAIAALAREAGTVNVEAVDERPDDSSTVSDKPEVDNPSNSIDDTPPPLRRADLCQDRGAGPLQLEVTLQEQDLDVAIGVETATGWVTGPAGISFIDFGDAERWADGRHLPMSNDLQYWLTFRAPAPGDIDTASSVIAAVLNQGCHASVFASVPASVVPEALSLSCRTPETGRTLAGVLLIDPAEPPSDCDGSLPTMVVGSGLSTDIDAWANAYGCTGQSSQPLFEGASLVTFDQCRHSLALVDLQRPVDDLWTDPGLTSAILGQLKLLR